jgi:hypothetical protein
MLPVVRTVQSKQRLSTSVPEFGLQNRCNAAMHHGLPAVERGIPCLSPIIEYRVSRAKQLPSAYVSPASRWCDDMSTKACVTSQR